MVVALIDGVVKLVPVPSRLPPLAASYHLISSPLFGFAEMTRLPVPHRLASPPDGAAGLIIPTC